MTALREYREQQQQQQQQQQRQRQRQLERMDEATSVSTPQYLSVKKIRSCRSFSLPFIEPYPYLLFLIISYPPSPTHLDLPTFTYTPSPLLLHLRLFDARLFGLSDYTHDHVERTLSYPFTLYLNPHLLPSSQVVRCSVVRTLRLYLRPRGTNPLRRPQPPHIHSRRCSHRYRLSRSSNNNSNSSNNNSSCCFIIIIASI